MAQKQLDAKVVLGGQTTAGFNALATKVEHLGQVVGQVSDKIIDVGDESVQVFKDYELNMAATRAIYQENLGSINQAAKAMDTLEQKTQEWARTTIFHTDDVSAAVMNAAQAGWDWEEQLEGIPRAMMLAQAGQLDLQQGLSYLARALNVTNTSFDNSGRFVDQWVKASTLANLTIEDLGQSMSTMGKTATFAGGTAQLFSMLDVLADTGTVGSQAGTQLRSMMLRVVAPTKKASEAFAMLGSDAEELEEILEDEALVNAAKRLEELGFSAYDEKGNLKDFLAILTDMDVAMESMTEQERNATLKDIFPTRSFATALSLIEAIKSGRLPELYDAIADSEGAAQRRSDIMMDTLFGDLTALGSKWEELERKFGSIESGEVRSVADGIGGIIDKLNEMPEEQLSALVGGLEAIAILGVGTQFGGAVLKFFGALGWKGAALLLAAGAIGSLVGYLRELDDQQWEGHFGNVMLDVEELADSVGDTRTPFKEAKEQIGVWEEAVRSAQQTYEEASSSFTESSLMAALKGKELTEQEIGNIKKYGNDLGAALLEGINSARQKDLTLINALFGDLETQSDIDNFVKISDLTNANYDTLTGQAEALGQQLRDATTEALRDKVLDEREREAIEATRSRLNQIMTEIGDLETQAAFQARLHAAGRVNWDSMSEYAKRAEAEYQARKTEAQSEFDTLYGRVKAEFEYAKKHGTVFKWNGINRTVTDNDWGEIEAALQSKEQEYLQAEQYAFGETMGEALRAVLHTGWEDALAVYDEIGSKKVDEVNWTELAASGMTTEDLNDLYANRGKIRDAFAAFADTPDVGGLLDFIDSIPTISARLSDAYIAMQYAWRDFQRSGGAEDPNNYFSTEEERAQLNRYSELQWEIEKAEIAENQARQNLEDLRRDLDHATEQVDRYAQNGNTANYGVWQERKESLQQERIPAAEEALYNAQAQLAMLQAEFDAFDSTLEVTLPDGSKLAYDFTKEVQDSLGSATMDIWLKKRGFIGGEESVEGFARGGRTTEAAIFGEVPGQAEWAIPEEHSLNTASLLDQTRAASGFTWGELDALSGGNEKNSAAKSVEIHITYSPNIQAQDARGVDAVLKADKERLEKMVRRVLEDVKTEERASALA